MTTKKSDLSILKKILILFFDFTLFSILFSISQRIVSIVYLDPYFFNTWPLMLVVYFIYFLIPEFYLKRTLGMKVFKVAIDYSLENFRVSFFKYSILIILDRFFLLVFYYPIKLLLQSENSLLLSEKYSGLRWFKVKNNV